MCIFYIHFLSKKVMFIEPIFKGITDEKIEVQGYYLISPRTHS